MTECQHVVLCYLTLTLSVLAVYACVYILQLGSLTSDFREEVDHPNGSGKIERRVLQARLLQELRALNVIVKVVKSKSGDKL